MRTLSKIVLVLFIAALTLTLVGPVNAVQTCEGGVKPPCPLGDGPTRIHPATGVVIDLTGAGLRISHEPAGIVIDITGAGYTCDGATNCRTGLADVVITDTRAGVIWSFSVEESTITVDGLNIVGTTDIFDWFVSPSVTELCNHDQKGMCTLFSISSTGGGMVYCITTPCDAENSIRINPQGVIIDTNDLIFPGVVEGTFFTRDCLDHDHCLRAENSDGNVSIEIFGSLTRIKIVLLGTTLRKISNFTATRT